MGVSLARVFLTTTAFAVFLVIAASIYQQIENTSFLDAWFHSVMTSTTIGYANAQPNTEGGKVFTSLVSFLTIGAFLYTIDTWKTADYLSLKEEIRKTRRCKCC